MSRMIYTLPVITAALLVSSPLVAKEPDIASVARRVSQPAWLTVDGPDQDGFYKARIMVSDLNLSSESERVVLGNRVRSGVRHICRRVAYDGDGQESAFQSGIS